MSGQRGLNGDLRRLAIARFPHQHHIRIRHRAQPAAKVISTLALTWV